MATTNLDNAGVDLKQIPNWDVGIDTSKPGTEIADNAAQDILNFEHDDSSNLSARAGILALMADTFTDPIKTVFDFQDDSGSIAVLLTSGNKLWKVQRDGTGLTDITGGLTLPTNNKWQFVTYRGLAIGANKATSGDNPVKVNGAGTAAALGGSPPNFKYLAVWNDRLWGVDADNPSTVWGSELGDPEGWSTMSAGGAEAGFFDFDPEDGDMIMGLHATKETLFVLKRQKIYKFALINEAEPATDITNLKKDIHSSSIGTVSAYSIQPILDDVIYYSELGLASLRLSEAVEDFRTALLSQLVVALQRTPKTTDEIPAYVFPDVSQYWLSIPASISLTGSKQVFVMDYSRGMGSPRWVRFDGLAAGTAYDSYLGDQGRVYLIAAENADGDHMLYTYIPREISRAFSDAGEAYTKQIITKAYTMDVPLRRKEFHHWAAGLSLWTDTAQIAVSYFLDGNQSKGGSYAAVLTSGVSGARWDSALWDSSEWDSAVETDLDIVRKFKYNSSGRRGQSVTFKLLNAQDSEGIVLKHLDIYYSFITEKGVKEV